MSVPETSAPQEGRLAEDADQVPQAVVAAARAAFRRKTDSARLARLAFDSQQDLLGPVEPRWLRFEHDAVALEVYIAHDGCERRLSASSSPPAALSVERYGEPPGGRGPLGHDSPFPGRKGDLVRVAAHAEDARPAPIHTEWFRL